MKKLILTLTFAPFFLTALKSSAQSYHHGFGFQYNFALFNEYGNTLALGVPSLTYKATLGFEAGPVGLGVSTHPSLGGYISTQSDVSYFGAEIPLLGEVYFGDMEEQCFYTGLGFSAGVYTDFYEGRKILGPQIEIGGHFYFRENLVGMRAFYTKGINGGTQHLSDGTIYKEKIFSTGLSFYYILGQ